MTDTKKLNTTCKRLQMQCFRNYVLCNAIDEKLNDLDNNQQKINDELHDKLNDLDSKFTKQFNTLQKELATKITKQQRRLSNVYAIFIMILLIRLTCIVLLVWWFLQK